jgi:hypothetical protein
MDEVKAMLFEGQTPHNRVKSVRNRYSMKEKGVRNSASSLPSRGVPRNPVVTILTRNQ